MTLRHDTLVSFLKRENLCAEEVHIFDAVKRWAKAKCEEKRLDPSGEAIREILGDAVDFVRFPTMSQKEFTHHVVPTGILSSDEALEVYQFWSGVTPATEMKFSCTKREGIFLKSPLLRCGRYTDDTRGSSRIFNGLTDSLTFQTDRDIYFRGVRLYAGFLEGQDIRAVVRILTEENGAELTAQEGTFIIGSTFSGSSRYTYGFDVLFKFAVRIGALSKYRIHVTVKGIDGGNVRFNGTKDPITTANVSDVHFTFEGTSRQILELLFHTVN